MRSDNISFENTIFLQTSLIVSVFAFVSGTLDVLLKLEFSVIVITYLVSVITLLLFLYTKKTGNFRLSKPFITFIFILLTNGAWYFNYASDGSVLGIFVVLIIFFSFIWDKKSSFYINGLILINVFLLFYVEWRYPEILLKYSSQKVKIIDLYVGTIFYLIIVAFFSWYAKNNYLKKYELVKQTEDLKSRFLHNLSHDIKTPINSILGFTQIINDPSISEAKKQLSIKYIESNGHYMLAIMNDLVDWLSIEHKKTTLNETKFDLHQLLNHLKVDLDITISPKQKINLFYDDENENRQLVIQTDEVKLKRILTNLINNAIKFTREGSIHFGYEIKNKQTIQFYVSDTGKGIQPKDQLLIFDRFQQLNNDKTYINSGSGLGLSICKYYTTLLGGNIWVESTPGKGSIFYFTIQIHLEESKPVTSDL